MSWIRQPAASECVVYPPPSRACDTRVRSWRRDSRVDIDVDTSVAESQVTVQENDVPAPDWKRLIVEAVRSRHMVVRVVMVVGVGVW
jgi:hypothetical protein